ncbi:CerR family C-terminal domain-containing protein [Pontixanthobacter sp. CEM42]|uniref:CerR family C-terminal domain-containing protein n=1 Tax=Pontixanthobacter sp. CEM42 TaxID=2792077 RepID=UPI001AE09C48
MKQRLIETAIEKFGKHGLDGASTRDIAAAADTAMSSITYHFGGKDGLYQAAAEHIFSHLRNLLSDPPIDLPSADASDEKRLDVVCTMLGRVAGFMLRDESAAFSLFIAREQQLPSPLVRELMRNHMEQTMSRLSGQIALLRPEMDQVDVRATALFLFGMAVTLRHSRTALHLLMEVDEIDQKLKQRLLTRLDTIIRAALKE